MYNLIKNNTIQFDRIILEHYYKLNIDEIDTIILIRLHDLLQKKINVLKEDEIAISMKLSKNELGKRIVSLVKKGYITLELSSVNSKEIFNLDETYKRIAMVLTNKVSEVNEDILQTKIRKTMNLLEKELKKILSPLEREMVIRWFVEDDYSEDQINEAILKALKYKNRGVSYIDRLLQTTRRDSKIEEDGEVNKNLDNNVQELFNKYYARSK